MTDLRKAAEAALAAMESGPDVDPIFAGETITALRTALELPEQEPFGWLYESRAGVRIFHFVSDNKPLVQADWEAAQQYPETHKMTPLYAAPPQRKPLTGEKLEAMYEDYVTHGDIVRAVERAHGIGVEE